MVDTLKLIYERIEFKDHHEDIAETWEITDKELNRAIFSELFLHDALLKCGATDPVTAFERDSILKPLLYQDGLRIICRKRYYDDEIGSMEFHVSEKMRLAPLTDWVHISDLLGSTLYERIKKRDYAHVKLTRSTFGSREPSDFDLYLHASTAKVTFLFSGGSISGMANSPAYAKDRWAFSAFGKLGDDFIGLPFWFKGTMVGGAEVAYCDSLGFNRFDRDYKKSSVSLGVEVPINFVVEHKGRTKAGDVFRDRKLVGSSINLFIKGTLVPHHDFSNVSQRAGKYFELSLQGSFSIRQRRQNDFPADTDSTFYSINNSITAAGALQHLANHLNVQAGVSWHDLNLFWRQKEDLKGEELRKLRPTKNNFLPFFQIGVGEDGKLLQYQIAAEYNRNITLGYGFFVFKALFLLSNTFGVDFKYFRALNAGNVPAWHYRSYLFLSPVLRINY